MWLSKTERYKLAGGGKHRWGPPPSVVALEPPALELAGGRFDGDIDERLAAGAAAGAEHDTALPA